jgi:nucleoside-diphosphate-sugar epimerase
MQCSNILVTGAGSGLGRHLCDYFNAMYFLRSTPFDVVMKQAAQKPFDMIIHAAFNPKHDISSLHLPSYLNDTIVLTQKLVQVPHHSFVFISSGDVYPKNDALHQEDEDILLKDVDNLYGVTKLIAESIVKEEANNPLVLRPTALLGRFMRKNSLIKILTEDPSPLTLSGQSTFNYVLHADVSEFIQKARVLHLTGTYNMAASSNVTLEEVAAAFNRSVCFGKYHYQTGNISNHKAVSVLPNFERTSLDTIHLYMQSEAKCATL